MKYKFYFSKEDMLVVKKVNIIERVEYCVRWVDDARGERFLLITIIRF